MCDRTFQVIYNDSTSCIIQVTCSVPQGSVLGLRLFIVYTADLEEKVDERGVNYHAYTDAMQLYLRCRCKDMSTAVDTLEHCITDISQWIDVGQPS